MNIFSRKTRRSASADSSQESRETLGNVSSDESPDKLRHTLVVGRSTTLPVKFSYSYADALNTNTNHPPPPHGGGGAARAQQNPDRQQNPEAQGAVNEPDAEELDQENGPEVDANRAEIRDQVGNAPADRLGQRGSLPDMLHQDDQELVNAPINRVQNRRFSDQILPVNNLPRADIDRPNQGLNTQHNTTLNGTSVYQPSDRLGLNGTHYANALLPSRPKTWCKKVKDVRTMPSLLDRLGNELHVNEAEVQRISTLLRPMAPLYDGRPREWCYRFRLALSGVSVDFSLIEARVALFSVLALRLPYEMLRNMPRDSVELSLDFVENYDVTDANLATVLTEKPVQGERPSVLWRKKLSSLTEAMPECVDAELNKTLAWQVVSAALPVEYLTIVSAIKTYPTPEDIEILDRMWQGMQTKGNVAVQRFNSATMGSASNTNVHSGQNSCDDLNDLKQTLCNFINTVQNTQPNSNRPANNRPNFQNNPRNRPINSTNDRRFRPRANSAPNRNRIQPRQSNIDPTTNLNPQGICWYHETYGSKARKCKPGCRYVTSSDENNNAANTHLN